MDPLTMLLLSLLDQLFMKNKNRNADDGKRFNLIGVVLLTALPIFHASLTALLIVEAWQINNYFLQSRKTFHLNIKVSQKQNFLSSFRSQVAVNCINNMKKFLLQAAIVSSLIINFSQSRRLGIVGGEAAEISKFPFMAAYIVNGTFRCGASILSKDWCLTAGRR